MNNPEKDVTNTGDCREEGSDDNTASDSEEEGDDDGGYVLLSQLASDDEDNDADSTSVNTTLNAATNDTDTNVPVNKIEICRKLFLIVIIIIIIIVVVCLLADVDEVKKAMSGFNLPSSVTPTWAQSVPLDVWKKELLEGLRNKNTPHP